MDDSPALLLPKVAGDTPRPRPAPDDVWRDLLAAAPPRERMMARLAGEAGLRRAEVAQCRLDDLVMDRGGWALIVRGKGNKQRIVPVTDSLAREIRSYCQHGYLFPSPAGGHLNPKWVGAIISRLMPPGVTMHALRHRFSSRGYAQTRNIVAVSQALGHSSIATTQRYVAITRDEVRAVVEAAADNEPTGPGAA